MKGFAKMIDNLFVTGRMTETEEKKLHTLDLKVVRDEKLNVTEERFITNLHKRYVC